MKEHDNDTKSQKDEEIKEIILSSDLQFSKDHPRDLVVRNPNIGIQTHSLFVLC